MAGSLVDRATSDMLIGPDWAMNVQICEIISRDPGQAKDVVKGLRKRIGHKNPKVQLLALTLLETVIKHCGEIVHMHVADRDVLRKMVKIVKKKPDAQVKEKILTLIDTWQEAFGGPRATYPQYYAAYQELLQAGAVFPQRNDKPAPIFGGQKDTLGSYSPSGESSNFHQEVPESSVGSDLPALSLTEIQNARGIMDVLAEMLSAIDPGNKEGLRQEVIVDLVDQCHTYKQRVVQLINTTSDEEWLSQGLALNDDLQRLLAKHDAIATGIAVQVVKPKTIQALVDVDDAATSKETDQGSSATTTTMNQSPLQQLALPAPPPPPPPSSSANSLAIIDPNIDLLSGGDFSKPATENSTLALVPVGEPATESASSQNILALVDMFPNTSTQVNNNNPTHSSDAPFTLSAPQAFPSATPHQLNPQQLQPPASHANGSIPNPGPPQYGYTVYNGAQINQANTSGFTPQQPAQGYGGNDQGEALPLPPWEAQPVQANGSPSLQPQPQTQPQPLLNGQYGGMNSLTGPTGQQPQPQPQPLPYGQFGGMNSLTGPTGQHPQPQLQPLPHGQFGGMNSLTGPTAQQPQPQPLLQGQFGGMTSLAGPTGQPVYMQPQPQGLQPMPGSFMGVNHQQVTAGTQFGGLQPQLMQNSQYVGMYAPMQNGQMTSIYSQHMLGGGYGGYAAGVSQPNLSSRMLTSYGGYYQMGPSAYNYLSSSDELSKGMQGLSMRNSNMFPNKTSLVPSYVHQPKATPQKSSEDKHFGDLLSMAKTKQSNTAANKVGGL